MCAIMNIIREILDLEMTLLSCIPSMDIFSINKVSLFEPAMLTIR